MPFLSQFVSKTKAQIVAAYSPTHYVNFQDGVARFSDQYGSVGANLTGQAESGVNSGRELFAVGNTLYVRKWDDTYNSEVPAQGLYSWITITQSQYLAARSQATLILSL